MKTVVVSLYGGLGNQLFQYATGLALAHKHHAELMFDLSWFETVKTDSKLTTRKFALSPYGLRHETVPLTLTNSFYYKLARKLSLPIKNRIGIPIYFEKHYHFDHQLNQLSIPVHLDGYWQSFRYFESVRPLLVKQLTLHGELDTLNQAMLESIQATNSVCLHIRRGDYVTNPGAAKQHGTCSLAYYHSAIDRISKRYSEVAFFIFSDDIAWAKSNLKLSHAHTYVDINGSEDVHLDLLLMSACHDFIIANSSLSWWAAWLCQHPESHVIAPDHWFASGKQTTQDLIPDSWEKLSITDDTQ